MAASRVVAVRAGATADGKTLQFELQSRLEVGESGGEARGRRGGVWGDERMQRMQGVILAKERRDCDGISHRRPKDDRKQGSGERGEEHGRGSMDEGYRGARGLRSTKERHVIEGGA